jgi:hypothetical protein
MGVLILSAGFCFVENGSDASFHLLPDNWRHITTSPKFIIYCFGFHSVKLVIGTTFNLPRISAETEPLNL